MQLVRPGAPEYFANETVQSNHFIKFAMSQPAFLAQSMTLFRDNAPLQSMLADRNYIGTDGDYRNISKRGKFSYTKIGSREVRWPVESLKNKLGTMERDAVCDEYPLDEGMPGKAGSTVKIYLNTNWFSPRDVLELDDNHTQVFVYEDMIPREVSNGVWEHKIRLHTKTAKESYIDPELLRKGSKIGLLYNMYEEMSRTAYEKYPFGKTMRTFTTIMRFKWSISGTAQAIKLDNPVWTSHNGQKTWMDHADFLMMERFAQHKEIQSKWGKSTVSEDGKPQQKTEQGMDVWSGDGIMYQGDGSWDYAVPKLTRKWLDRLISDIRLYRNIESGAYEVGLLCGSALLREFTEVMNKEVKVQPEYIQGKSGGRGVKTTVTFYEYGGVRIYPILDGWYDDPTRPGEIGDDGTPMRSHDGMLVAMGNKDGLLNPAVEMLALSGRDFIKSNIQGANKPGQAANSVDAESTHLISETAIAVKDPDAIIRIFKPRLKGATQFYV